MRFDDLPEPVVVLMATTVCIVVGLCVIVLANAVFADPEETPVLELEIAERQHAVVRQVDIDPERGWTLTLETEPGPSIRLPSRTYRYPGETLWIGLTRAGWSICDPEPFEMEEEPR